MKLPTSWATAPLADICRKITDGSHNPPKPQTSGLPMLSAKNVSSRKIHFDDFRLISESDFAEEDRRTHIAPGDVLLTIVGAIGRSAVVPEGLERFTLQRSVAVLKPSAVNPRLLSYALEAPAIQRYLNDNAKGTAQKGIYLKALSEVVLPVPPEREQQRIADKLDTMLARVDGVNERLARVVPLLKRFRQSVLAAATSGRLTAEWRGGADPEWETLTAAEACTKVQSGGTPKSGFSSEGVPFVKVYNIVEQRLNFEYRPQFVSIEVHANELKKSQVIPGDVLMNIVGPPLCKVAVVPATHEQWNINQAITLFRPSAKVSSGWLYVVLSEGQQVRDVLKDTKGSVGQVNISLSQCRAFKLPVPSIEEQAELVRRVDLLFAFADRLEARLQRAQTTSARLTPSLLAKAFRGELVPQDPNDEPAAELLRRLIASNAETGRSSRARKVSA